MNRLTRNYTHDTHTQAHTYPEKQLLLLLLLLQLYTDTRSLTHAQQ